MAKLSPARRVALDVLAEAQSSGRYARELMPGAAAAAGLDARDAAFSLRLALGVTATVGCLDDALDRHLEKPKRVAPRARMALRISAFEALYLDAAPEVVVSQGVELVRSCAKSAAGLANAVLRRVCEGRVAFLDAEDATESQRPLVSRARRAGLPVWLVRRLDAAWGLELSDRIIAAHLRPAPTAVHVNPLECEGLIDVLANAGAERSVLPGCHLNAHAGILAEAEAFSRAQLVASDLNAQIVATAATRPGSCLEIGAGRGTKTFVMYCQAERARYARGHVSLDMYEGKCRANAERIDRAGFGSLDTVAGDACDLDAALEPLDRETGECRLFDTVLVDAPCSGTGTMRRHSEIPWRLDPADISTGLPELQLTMLTEASRRVAPGGELFFATCSIMPEENTGVLEAFLASEQGQCFGVEPLSRSEVFSTAQFRPAKALIEPHEDGRGAFQTLPIEGSFDGHFCVRLVRN